MDLHPRKLRYFIAVAEELNFGRAAKRLFIAQQSLSAQIKELEGEVGARLFDRNTRKVELTAAGEVLLAAAMAALDMLDTAVADARRVASGALGTLRLGFVPGSALELTRPILAEFRTRFPDVAVELREFSFRDPSAGLVDGWADAAFVRPPFSAIGVESETLFVEPRVVALADDHPLAGRAALPLDEVLALPLAVGATPDDTWVRFWTLADYRSGRPSPRLTRTHTQTEENEIVASGDACCVTVASLARLMPHAGVRLVPIDGVSGSAVALAWPAERPAAAVANLVAVAREVRARERDVIAAIEHPAPLT